MVSEIHKLHAVDMKDRGVICSFPLYKFDFSYNYSLKGVRLSIFRCKSSCLHLLPSSMESEDTLFGKFSHLLYFPDFRK